MGFLFIFFLVYIFFCVYIYRHFQISDIGQSLCVASAELSWSQNAFFNMWFMKSHGKRQTKKKILEKKKNQHIIEILQKIGEKIVISENSKQTWNSIPQIKWYDAYQIG